MMVSSTLNPAFPRVIDQVREPIEFRGRKPRRVIVEQCRNRLLGGAVEKGLKNMPKR
jgi:hypothetical protein